ncbi:MAG TPA: DUF4105 domain-containing protein [Longimicrobium sp.]|nr:DUF4105 domain-containing protein [Longimicrobium sp.]
MIPPTAVLAAALSALPLAAQVPAAPDTGLTVHLLTMGSGDAVWEKFGHNAIWIHDPAAGTDLVYNYGVFDFRSPGYWNRFIKGTWRYELGVSDMATTMWQYQYLNRSVWSQRLNLTPAQEREVQRFLGWNARPENKEYLYDYYRDNCSTRLRDLIDRVTGGELRRVANGVHRSRRSYRWHSERYVGSDWATYAGLAVGLGPAADRPTGVWEDMFLPFELMKAMRSAKTGPQPWDRLVAEERTLFQATGRGPEPRMPPVAMPIFLAAGVLLAGALVLLGRGAMRSRAARFGFSALSAVWLLFAGTGGVVLLGLWALTDHQIAYRNENILQLSPLALPLVLLLPCLAYGARWAARPARLLAFGVAGMSLLGLLCQVLPFLFPQRNGHVVMLALPVNLAIALTAWWLSRRVEAAPAPARTA